MPLPAPSITGELFDSISKGSRFQPDNLAILKSIYVNGESRHSVSSRSSLSYAAIVALERRFDKRIDSYLRQNNLSLVMDVLPTSL
jgi:hypothetical protein